MAECSNLVKSQASDILEASMEAGLTLREVEDVVFSNTRTLEFFNSADYKQVMHAQRITHTYPDVSRRDVAEKPHRLRKPGSDSRLFRGACCSGALDALVLTADRFACSPPFVRQARCCRLVWLHRGQNKRSQPTQPTQFCATVNRDTHQFIISSRVSLTLINLILVKHPRC